MAFGRKHITLPKTKAACQKLWDEASSRKLAKGYLAVAGNTELHKEGDEFALYFHNQRIVVYHDGYKVVDACGYSASPTTQGRIQSATGAWMYSNNSLGYEQFVRIGSYPYFAGIRVDDYGQVLPEDQRPDYKTVNKKPVVNAYTTLFKRIEKLITGRYELGEWRESGYANHSGQLDALFRIEAGIAEGETFLLHSDVSFLLGNSMKTALRERLTEIKENLRHDYYTRNNGYERIEVTA